MAKREKLEGLTWMNIEPSTLGKDHAKAYAEYKAAYAAATAKREKFEELMQTMAPKGKRLVFGYKFGKLSIAAADKLSLVKPAAKGAVSMEQFLKTA